MSIPLGKNVWNDFGLKEIYEDFGPDYQRVVLEALKRGIEPGRVTAEIQKYRAAEQFAKEQKAKEAAAHDALYGPDAPGMAPSIEDAAGLWTARFGDVWKRESDLDNDYRVMLQRLCKFGAFEIVGNFNSHAALYRLLPREMWGTQCK